ncbi:MAG: fasciclin domain-containing protein [Thermoplasmata archaeon]
MPDIVDTAVSAGSFRTLVQAVQAAGLVETLKGPGPFTVFAPTDAAFAKLPPGTVEALLKDPARLRSVLTYHVVPKKVRSADVLQMASGGKEIAVPTVQGSMLHVRVEGLLQKKVHVNGATVVQPDIEATNGVIHVIDSVVLPA